MINEDWKTDNGDNVLSIRVGAIIIRGYEVLMVQDERMDYLYTIGGRVKVGEDSVTALRREMMEELGISLEIERLGYVSETRFRSQNLKDNGREIYELGYYFYVILPANSDFSTKNYVDDGIIHHLKWVDVRDNILMHPAFIRDAVMHPKPTIQHIILDERDGEAL